MGQYATGANVLAVIEILEKPVRCMKMIDHNYRLALRHFTEIGFRRWIGALMIDIFGAAWPVPEIFKWHPFCLDLDATSDFYSHYTGDGGWGATRMCPIRGF